MCSEDEALALACYEGALSVAPDLIVMVLAATAQERAIRRLGGAWAGEIFADRAYEEDGRLVDRRKPGAMIHDAAYAGLRMARMVQEGAILTETGTRLETRIDTICCHGDTPEAVEIARSVRAALESEGIEVAMMSGTAAAG